MSEWSVTTVAGNKAHIAKDNGWATLCGREVYGPVDAAQLKRSPHLRCQKCAAIDRANQKRLAKQRTSL